MSFDGLVRFIESANFLMIPGKYVENESILLYCSEGLEIWVLGLRLRA